MNIEKEELSFEFYKNGKWNSPFASADCLNWIESIKEENLQKIND